MSYDTINLRIPGLSTLIGLQGYQVYQTSKLVSAVDNLNNSIQIQTELLSEQNAILNSLTAIADESLQVQKMQLAEATKVSKIAEIEHQRRQTDNFAKETIFQLKLEFKRISNFNSNLEKYFQFNNLYNFFQHTNIKFEHLSQISDKEYMYDTIQQLQNEARRSLENLSNEEIEILSELETQSTKIKAFDSLKEISITYLAEKQNLIELKEKEILTKYNLEKQRQHGIKFAHGILLVILSYVLKFLNYLFFSNSKSWDPVINFSFYVGILIIAFTMLRGIYYAVKDSSDDNLKETNKLNAENKRQELLSELKISFLEKIKGLDNLIDKEIDVDLIKIEVEKIAQNLNQWTKSVSNKYPELPIVENLKVDSI